MDTVPHSGGTYERSPSTTISGDVDADASARNANQRPRTVIVSDVRLYREGLALVLGARPDVELIGSCETVGEAVPFLASGAETVLVLDAGMPHAREVAREVMRAAPATKIVAVAVADETADVIGCAEAGMAGYVTRDGSVDEVVATIHSVVRGETRCPPQVVATLFRRLASLAPGASGPVAREPLLTRRELEIVALIDQGLSNKEIGRHLRIGTPTVKNHVHHILEKLHVTRRGQAAASVRASHAVPLADAPNNRPQRSGVNPAI